MNASHSCNLLGNKKSILILYVCRYKVLTVSIQILLCESECFNENVNVSFQSDMYFCSMNTNGKCMFIFLKSNLKLNVLTRM